MIERDTYSRTKEALAAYVPGLTARQLAATCEACPDRSIQPTLRHHHHRIAPHIRPVCAQLGRANAQAGFFSTAEVAQMTIDRTPR